MRKIFAMTTAALLIALPAPLLAQHHGGGGGGGGHGGGGGGGFHGGGGGGGAHMGGGGGFHGGGGGGGFHGGGGGHVGGDHHGGFGGGGNHFGAEHRSAVGGGFDNHGGGHNVVINNNNRTVVRNDSFRGNNFGGRGNVVGNGGRANFAGGGHGLPAAPGRGAWRQGWYGGHVNGFRPIHAGYYRYPSGWGYRRWGIGLVLPAVLFGSAYYYYNWNSLGAYPPPPGDRWVRYGPDLLLVNIPTGRVDDAIYGAFY